MPRRRATLVATWHEIARASFTLAARYASRSFGTIDNSDPVSHTFQGFENYFVLDARADFRVSRRIWNAAIGVENLGNDQYYLFHPFPQRSLTASWHGDGDGKSSGPRLRTDSNSAIWNKRRVVEPGVGEAGEPPLALCPALLLGAGAQGPAQAKDGEVHSRAAGPPALDEPS